MCRCARTRLWGRRSGRQLGPLHCASVHRCVLWALACASQGSAPWPYTADDAVARLHASGCALRSYCSPARLPRLRIASVSPRAQYDTHRSLLYLLSPLVRRIRSLFVAERRITSLYLLAPLFSSDTRCFCYFSSASSSGYFFFIFSVRGYNPVGSYSVSRFNISNCVYGDTYQIRFNIHELNLQKVYQSFNKKCLRFLLFG